MLNTSPSGRDTTEKALQKLVQKLIDLTGSQGANPFQNQSNNIGSKDSIPVVLSKLNAALIDGGFASKVNGKVPLAQLTNIILDEDDMVSDSDQHVPSQQSVKAYVDANSDYATAAQGALADTALQPSIWTPQALGNVSGVLALDADTSHVAHAEVTGDITNITMANLPIGGVFRLRLTSDLLDTWIITEPVNFDLQSSLDLTEFANITGTGAMYVNIINLDDASYEYFVTTAT